MPKSKIEEQEQLVENTTTKANELYMSVEKELEKSIDDTLEAIAKVSEKSSKFMEIAMSIYMPLHVVGQATVAFEKVQNLIIARGEHKKYYASTITRMKKINSVIYDWLTLNIGGNIDKDTLEFDGIEFHKLTFNNVEAIATLVKSTHQKIAQKQQIEVRNIDTKAVVETISAKVAVKRIIKDFADLRTNIEAEMKAHHQTTFNHREFNKRVDDRLDVLKKMYHAEELQADVMAEFYGAFAALKESMTQEQLQEIAIKIARESGLELEFEEVA